MKRQAWRARRLILNQKVSRMSPESSAQNRKRC